MTWNFSPNNITQLLFFRLLFWNFLFWVFEDLFFFVFWTGIDGRIRTPYDVEHQNQIATNLHLILLLTVYIFKPTSLYKCVCKALRSMLRTFYLFAAHLCRNFLVFWLTFLRSERDKNVNRFEEPINCHSKISFLTYVRDLERLLLGRGSIKISFDFTLPVLAWTMLETSSQYYK